VIGSRARAAIAPFAGVALSLSLLSQTRTLDDVAQPGQLGPAFWPRMILGALAIVSLAKLVLDVWRNPSSDESASRSVISRHLLVVAIATILLYVALTPVIGFALATAVFAAVFMALGGTRSAVAVVATAALSTLAVLYLFIKLVYLPLPKGVGVMEQVTLALYRALGIF
jgi:putative tricarboxylic transport membrane protein